MTYNFDELVDRRGSNSCKWDRCCDPEVIPMWIADMDFKTAPFIQEAIQNRINHGIFGYTNVPETYYEATIKWFQKRRGWTIERESIQYIGGIVPAIAVSIEALTKPSDKVILFSPAYNCFFSAIRDSGRTLSENKLIRQGDSFVIDFEDFEKKCADPDATLFLLCNPHNPSGRVWTKEELEKVHAICKKHNVKVISDEIHCELEMPGYKTTSFGTVDPEAVVFASPSKSFNIAGLQISNIIAPVPADMEALRKVINHWEHCDVNPIGVSALEAAYTPEGEEWLKQFNEYVCKNYEYLRSEFEKNLPELKVSKLEGTYLPWVDCSVITKTGKTMEEVTESLKTVEKVWINPGRMYGDENYVRINIACPRARLEEGVRRMVAGFRRIIDNL